MSTSFISGYIWYIYVQFSKKNICNHIIYIYMARSQKYSFLIGYERLAYWNLHPMNKETIWQKEERSLVPKECHLLTTKTSNEKLCILKMPYSWGYESFCYFKILIYSIHKQDFEWHKVHSLANERWRTNLIPMNYLAC